MSIMITPVHTFEIFIHGKNFTLLKKMKRSHCLKFYAKGKRRRKSSHRVLIMTRYPTLHVLSRLFFTTPPYARLFFIL